MAREVLLDVAVPNWAIRTFERLSNFEAIDSTARGAREKVKLIIEHVFLLLSRESGTLQLRGGRDNIITRGIVEIPEERTEEANRLGEMRREVNESVGVEWFRKLNRQFKARLLEKW